MPTTRPDDYGSRSDWHNPPAIVTVTAEDHARVVQQRDELLKACEAMIEHIEQPRYGDDHVTDAPWGEITERMRTAIAACTAGELRA